MEPGRDPVLGAIRCWARQGDVPQVPFPLGGG